MNSTKQKQKRKNRAQFNNKSTQAHGIRNRLRTQLCDIVEVKKIVVPVNDDGAALHDTRVIQAIGCKFHQKVSHRRSAHIHNQL